MKKSILLSFSLLCFAGLTKGQQFLNGSFEPTGSLTSCHYMPTATFNAGMGNVFSIHTSVPGDTNTYVADNSCGLGNAAAGTHYVGLQYTPTGGSCKLVLKLNAPMTANHLYTFTWSLKGGGGAPNAYYVGYTDDSSSAPISYAKNLPNVTTWTAQTDTITPGVAARFLVIGFGTGGSVTSTLYMDNFIMSGVPGLDVPKVSIENKVILYPDPITNTATLQLGNNIALPCKMEMYDLSGRIVLQQQNLTDRSIHISKGDMNSGLYFIRIQDANRNTYSLKASVQ